MPSTAAIEPPIGTPDIISVATSERRAGEAYSATRALADGTRPPRPSPARKRNAPNVPGEGASAHSAVNTENQTVQPSTAPRRPMRSASAPAARAPRSMPRKASEPRNPAELWVSSQPGSSSRRGTTVP